MAITRNQRGCGTVALLVVTLLGTPALAEGQPDLRVELQRRATERGLSREETQAILDRAGRLGAADLPAASVLDRYLEGLSRGAPLERIESVVDQLEGRLREAARRVDVVFPPDHPTATREARFELIDHSAAALAAGVPADGLEKALRLPAEAGQSMAAGNAPVLAMNCLVAGGLEPNASLDLVRTAWVNGCRGRDLERLGRDVGSLGEPGQGPPPEVLRQVHDVLRSHADRDKLFQCLEAMRGPGDSRGPGQHPPGMRPGDDPSDMHGPGGPPDDPAHQGPGGKHPHGPRPPG